MNELIARGATECPVHIGIVMPAEIPPNTDAAWSIVWADDGAWWKTPDVRYDLWLDGVLKMTTADDHGTIRVNTPGEHTFYVTVYVPQLTCTPHATWNFTVKRLVDPKVVIHRSDSPYYAGSAVFFSVEWITGEDEVRDGDYWYWDWGDGESTSVWADMKWLSHVYDNEGHYTVGVQLVLRSSLDRFMVYDYTEFDVQLAVAKECPPTLEISVSPSSPIVGQQCSVAIDWKNGQGLRSPGDVYKWDLGDGQGLRLLSQSFNATFNEAKVYHIQAQVVLQSASCLVDMFVTKDVSVTPGTAPPKPPTTPPDGGMKTEYWLLAGGGVLLLASLALTLSTRGDGRRGGSEGE